jgi:DNA-binding transcriptional ArsR family regulator
LRSTHARCYASLCMDSNQIVQRRLACLGDPSRFRIVQRLAADRLCVSELAGEVRLSQSCTTRHLQALTGVGMVRPERQGKRVLYVLRDEDPDVARLLHWLRIAAATESGSGSNPTPRSPRPASAHDPNSNGDRLTRARGPAAKPQPPVSRVPANPAIDPARTVLGPPTDPDRAGPQGPEHLEATNDGQDFIRPIRRDEDLEDFLL